MTGSSDRHSAQTDLTGAEVVGSGREQVGEVTGHLWTMPVASMWSPSVLRMTR
jgi:hypothetical protein